MSDAAHDEEDSPKEGVRLQKLLASAGVDSRRKCEEYVVTGRVSVDGEVVTDPGFKADPETQDVRLDGERIRPQKKRYYLLNKPTGYLCTNYDPAGRRRAVDLVPAGTTRSSRYGARAPANPSGSARVCPGRSPASASIRSSHHAMP